MRKAKKRKSEKFKKKEDRKSAKSMLLYANSVSNDERIGAIWYHAHDNAAPVQNADDEGSESVTSLSSPHYVLIMSVTDEEDALCLVFTSKERNGIARLPVRSQRRTPAPMTGLQFDPFPNCFRLETWIHYNSLVYLPLASLRSVHGRPRLTRQDWAVLLLFNRSLKHCDVAHKFTQPDPPPPSSRPPSPPPPPPGDHQQQPPRDSSHVTYATIVKKAEKSGGGAKEKEAWMDFVDSQWLHGHTQLVDHMHRYCHTEPVTVQSYLQSF